MKLSVFSRWLISITILTISLVSPIFSEESILAPKASLSLLLDVQQLSSGRLVAVGERGHILVSDDQGMTWQQKQVPTRSVLTALDFYDDKWGVAVGYEQTILITKDAGETWTLNHYRKDSVDNPALFDVEFVSLQKIITVGSYGLYLQSNDGGDQWRERQVASLADIYEGFSHFYGIAVQPNSKILYLVGEKYVAAETADGDEISTGLLAISQDNGDSWTKLTSPYDGSFFGVNVATNNEVFAYGLKGNLYRSANQGTSWQKIDLNTNSGLHDLEFVDDNQWYLVGTSGTLLNSKGESIKPREDLKGRAALVALDKEYLLIVGEGGVERVSTQVE